MEIISSSEGVISNDSGLMHVSASLDRKIIALYGSSSPTYTPPLISKEKREPKPRKINLISKIILGSSAGFFSAPMGIGGAVMNVPILKFFGYPINKAIGSAAAIGFIIALFGAVGFLI